MGRKLIQAAWLVMVSLLVMGGTILGQAQTEIYTVTFDPAGGSPTPPAQQVSAGGYATIPAPAPFYQQAGYQFNYWALEGIEFDFEHTPITRDITLVAR